MKSGVIIYVAGNAPQGWSEGDETCVRSTESQADLIEIIYDIFHIDTVPITRFDNFSMVT